MHISLMSAILESVKTIAGNGNSKEMIDMKSLFARIGRINFGGSYFDRYYQGIVGSGVGYPTADEARRDYQQVMATRNVPRNM